MIYKAQDVATYIIKKCDNDNLVMSNLKLQKVLYFLQAEFLITKGEPCFEDTIEAWDFGPVVPNVYKKYLVYGCAMIPAMHMEVPDVFYAEDKKIIDNMIKELSKYSTTTLVEITHQQKPWIDAYKPYTSKIITNESLLEFFKD